MKQNFDKNIHEKFKSYFDMKKSPSEVEEWFYNKTEKYIKYIKWIPWLKMIWIWNSIAMNCATSDSDIDLFIVTSPNSMWLNRIIITFIFQILLVRKNENHHAWRFCLSFFATTNWLDFSDWKIENDIYLYFWIIYFKPILDYDNTYELFLEKNSTWADFSEYSNIIEYNKSFVKYVNKNNSIWNYNMTIMNSISEICITFINNLLKKIFLAKTLKHFESIWKPYWVIINNDLLKFHNWDIRKKIKEDLISD
jgi:hypothetical protein